MCTSNELILRLIQSQKQTEYKIEAGNKRKSLLILKV